MTFPRKTSDCYVGVQFHKKRWLIYFTKVAGPCRSGHGVISRLMEVKIPELYSYTMLYPLNPTTNPNCTQVLLVSPRLEIPSTEPLTS